MCRAALDSAEARHAADDGLPETPRAPRFVERVVIEADRQEATQVFDHASPIVAEIASDVLRTHHQPGFNRTRISAHIGLRANLHQAVGVIAGQCVDAARPMVFEGSRQDAHAIGGQCTRDAVADITRVTLAIKAKADRLLAVDERAIGGGQTQMGARAHGVASALGVPNSSAAAKVCKMVSVAVSRSAMNQ